MFLFSSPTKKFAAYVQLIVANFLVRIQPFFGSTNVYTASTAQLTDTVFYTSCFLAAPEKKRYCILISNVVVLL